MSAPTLTIDFPAQGQTVISSVVLIRGVALDDVAVTSVAVRIKALYTGLWWNGAGWQETAVAVPTTLANPGTATTGWAISFAPAALGAYSAEAIASDGSASTSQTVNFRLTWDAAIKPPAAVGVSAALSDPTAIVKARAVWGPGRLAGAIWGKADALMATRWGSPWAVAGHVVWSALAPRSRTWDDLTPAWTKVTARSGRKNAQASYDVGTFDVGLRSATHRFDPANIASDLAGAMRAAQPASITLDQIAVASGVTKSWAVEHQAPGVSVTTMRCQDLLGVLNVDLPALAEGNGGERVDQRIRRIALRCGLTDDQLDLAVDDITLQATTLAGNQLSQAKLAADSAAGHLFSDAATGRLVYRTRTWRRSSPRSRTRMWTFTNILANLPGATSPEYPVSLCSGKVVDPEAAIERIWGVLTMARKDGEERTLTRPEVLSSWGIRSGPGRNDLMCESDSQVDAVLAAKLASVYASTRWFESVTIDLATSSANRVAASTLRIGDLVSLRMALPEPQSGPAMPPVDLTHWIEGIEHSWSNEGAKMRTTFYLSPAGIAGNGGGGIDLNDGFDVAPVLLFADEFTGSSVDWSKWSPNFAWQEAQLPGHGALDLGGRWSWLAHPSQEFGGTGSTILDEVPSSGWSAWYGAVPTFDTATQTLNVGATAQRLVAGNVLATAYTLTIKSAAGVTITPFIRAHNNGTSYIVPNEVTTLDPINGSLTAKSSSATGQTWTVTFSGARTNIDLRILTSAPNGVTRVSLIAPGAHGITLDPFVVSNSVLSILPRRTPAAARAGMAADLGVAEADTPDYVSGALSTRNVSFTTGYLEIRARFDNYRGMFPALWLYALGSVEYAKRGFEVDILEIFGNPSGAPWQVHLHYHDGAPGGGTALRDPFEWVSTIDTTQWHVYGFERTATALRWYLDGALVHEATGADATPFAGVAMEIRLTHAVGADWFDPANLPTW